MNNKKKIKDVREYRGKWVAWYKGKIIASGKTIQEVENKLGDKKGKVTYEVIPKRGYENLIV
ncbi:hypothetical protein ES703_81089 [subsurface metagenome]